MARFTITRSNISMPEGVRLDGVRDFLFKVIDGFGKDDKASWRRFWKRVSKMSPGDLIEVEMVFPRSGPYHRRHFALEHSVFDAQDVFDDFEVFRHWVKIGAAWVVWMPDDKGGLVPIPKSVSYAEADQDEFQRFHASVVNFLRADHAPLILWPHLGPKAYDMMNSILSGFEE
jgi:hypothetical protein